MDYEEIVDRMMRASALEVDLYEEVEADTTATVEALIVVVISSFAAGLGSTYTGGIYGIVYGTITALAGWVLWAFLTYLIGTKLLPVPATESDMGELLRTIGYSSSPGILRVFGFIPVLGQLVVFGVSIWMLVAMVIGVRQALDYDSTLRAVGVCVIGWLIQLVFVSIYMAS